MGCASSKPSSSSSKDKQKKNLKSKKSVENGSNGRLDEPATPRLNGLDSSTSGPKAVDLSPSLIEQIEQNSEQVIEHICRIVHRDLNAELISHKASMAAVVEAAAVAKDNDDLIRDVASKALLLIANKNQNYRPNTYNDLNDSLKATDFLFKNQTNKNRIIDLTVDTIERSVDAINHQMQTLGTQFSLVEFLKKNEPNDRAQMTPPQTPETKNSRPIQSTPSIDWDNAQLLSRAQATEVARILFLSNKARPVVHASPKAKDAYIVNKQVDDTEIALSKDEIDQILNRFDEQPRYIELVENYQSINISPITPQCQTTYLNETPHLSAYTNREIIHNDNCLNESVDESKIEELTNVTNQDETIQFASDTQESIKTSEINADLVANDDDDVNRQQSDNASNSEETNASLFVKTTIITETCVLTPPLDNENLEKDQLDPTLKQSLLDDRFYNNDSFKTEPPVNGEEENQAATVIQSAVRGHEARQGDVIQNESEIGVNQTELDSESEKAAIKIQATYRGFKTRKDLHHQKDDGAKNAE